MSDRSLSAVSNIYSEPLVYNRPPLDAPPGRKPRRRPWLRGLLLVLVSLWVADAGLSLLIQHSMLRQKLTARLSAAFGRPVQVDSYDLSFWMGPALEAQSVTVGEDPRFGNEYFLRADSLRVRLGWLSLLRGHLELGTLSLTRPSLNIVRNGEGEWNLEEWLPRPAVGPGQAPVFGPSTAGLPALRFRRIEVDGGRVNFKRANEKIPFALVGVAGTVETDSPGRWRMDLDATPWRAAVVIQQPGTVHVAGYVGGTSSRLLPAALDLAWRDASISDVLRLTRGDDDGIRGTLALTLSARTEGDTWMLQSRTELRELHRWDLASRPDNPSVNLIAKMKLYSEVSGLEITDARIEAPRSNARASGRILWNTTGPFKRQEASPVVLRVLNSAVDLGDVLAWTRAFHSGVGDGVSVHGQAHADLALSGWPMQMVESGGTIEGANVAIPGLRLPLHLSRAEFHYDQGRISLSPVTLLFGLPNGLSSGSFHMSTALKQGLPASFRLTGDLPQFRDLIAAAGAFGWNLSRGWDLSGPFRCDLHWTGPQFPWESEPTGTVVMGGADGETGGASLRAPFLNQAVEQIEARADLMPAARHIVLSSAQAFGARWNGTFDRRGSDGKWQFALSGDHLTAADLDRWLNPRWRESFLDRMLPFLNSRLASSAVPETLQASGHLSLGELTLAPFVVRQLQGSMKIEGRQIDLANAVGQLYGGSVNGSLVAQLGSSPLYRVNANFSAVDLSAMSAVSPQLADQFAGLASGSLSFDARGTTRAALIAELECHGAVHVNGPVLRGLDLEESLREGAVRPGATTFEQASAAFSCADRDLQFQDLLLQGPRGEIDGSGSVDFDRNLNLRLWVLPADSPAPHLSMFPDPGDETYLLTGSLASPQIVRSSLSPRRPR